MFGLEWKRVKRSAGGKSLALRGLTCPMLSPTGRCMVYSVRPFICRLWGTTPTLECPEGCQPTRWLSTTEAHAIFARVREAAGPEVAGPLGDVSDLWAGFQLEAREERARIIKHIEEVKRAELGRGSGSPEVPS